MSRVLEAIEAIARKQAQSVAIVSADNQLTYRDLLTRVNDLAGQLGDYHGQCAAIELDNGVDWVVVDLACIKAGIVTVPLPPFFTEKQKQHAIKQSGATLVFSAISEQGRPCPGTKRVFLNNCSPVDTKQSISFPVGTSKITFTSGTTGQAKGVCLSQQGMEDVASSLVDVVGTAAARKTAAVLPLSVLLENIAGCYATLMAGGCYDVQPQAGIGFNAGMIPDFVKLFSYLKASQASSCILVPELLRGLMKVSAQTKELLPAMNFIAVGGARVAPILLQQAKQLGLPVYQGYGLSEAASVVSLNCNTVSQDDSVGRLLPHVRVAIADDGEIIIKNAAFLGYLNSEQNQGDFYTGDIGHVDEHGFLYITGRKKNIIITSMGRNISPEWPESELLAQPQVAQAMVYDSGDKGLSALLVPADASVSQLQLTEAVTRVNTVLPEYAQISHWYQCPPFSLDNQQLTGTGRPRRKAILDMIKTFAPETGRLTGTNP